MKTLSYSVLVAVLFFLISCGQNTPAGKVVDSVVKKNVKITSLSELDLSMPEMDSTTFVTWKDRWARKGAYYMSQSALTFFDMPKEDLTGVLETHELKTLFYMGLDSGAITTQYPTGFSPHLMLIGADTNYVLDYNAIFDWTQSCPPDCPTPVN